MNFEIIEENIKLLGKSILLDNTLIISDIHIGYEEALNKTGILIPRTMFKIIYRELETTLKRYKPKQVIINGDLKHEFGKISNQEWKETKKIITLIKEYAANITIIKGNHDKILWPISEEINIETKDYIMLNDTYICHGHKIPSDQDFKKSKTIIIGHEHPCVSITDNHKTEKFKTFLIGKFKDKKLIVMPSFNPIEGTDIAKEKLLSPFLKDNNLFSNFEVYITADKIYHFGKLKELQN